MKTTAALLMTGVILITFSGCIRLKEKRLKKELQHLEQEYDKVNKRLDSLDQILEEMERRDSVTISTIQQDSSSDI